MNSSNAEGDVKDLSSVLKIVEKKVLENRSKTDGFSKTIKDFRRTFDQQSSGMNQAIFNDAPSDVIHQETLQTVSTLIEILSRTAKKDPVK